MKNGTGKSLPPPFFFHEIAYKYKTIWKYGQHKHIKVNCYFRPVAIHDVKVNPQFLHPRLCLTTSSQALMFFSGQIRVFFPPVYVFTFFFFLGSRNGSKGLIFYFWKSIQRKLCRRWPSKSKIHTQKGTTEKCVVLFFIFWKRLPRLKGNLSRLSY